MWRWLRGDEYSPRLPWVRRQEQVAGFALWLVQTDWDVHTVLRCNAHYWLAYWHSIGAVIYWRLCYEIRRLRRWLQ